MAKKGKGGGGKGGGGGGGGNRPRLPQPPPGQPPPGSLGLGLGLNPRQRARWQAAAKGGQGEDWLARHPGVQSRVNRLGATSPQATRLQNFIATGQGQKP